MGISGSVMNDDVIQMVTLFPFIQDGSFCSFSKNVASQRANPDAVGKSPHNDLKGKNDLPGNTVVSSCFIWFVSMRVTCLRAEHQVNLIGRDIVVF